MARAWADVALDAVAHNVRQLKARAGRARLCAVVKADGYGHGAVPVGRAALAAGADWLAVAQVDEAQALRQAGIDAPLLILSEPGPGELDLAVALGARITVYSPETVSRLAGAARRHGVTRGAAGVGAARGAGPVPVHLKVDTGMRRVGVAPDGAVALAKVIADHPEIELEGVCTHFPVADEPDRGFTADQIARFEAVLAELRGAGFDPPLRHAANSAGTLCFPEAHYDMVRCGIAVYGIPPAPALRGMLDLRPALRLVSEVSFVKPVPAGEGVSYGLHQRTARDTVVATVPIGYADGLFRGLPLAGGEVLIHGRRHPMIGVVTMDQVMVDCGPAVDAGDEVRRGDEVVLLGEQGGERIEPDEWAVRLGTIAYEVVCAIGPRVERRPA
jgi:alanine racemase